MWYVAPVINHTHPDDEGADTFAMYINWVQSCSGAGQQQQQLQ